MPATVCLGAEVGDGRASAAAPLDAVADVGEASAWSMDPCTTSDKESCDSPDVSSGSRCCAAASAVPAAPPAPCDATCCRPLDSVRLVMAARSPTDSLLLSTVTSVSPQSACSGWRGLSFSCAPAWYRCRQRHCRGVCDAC